MDGSSTILYNGKWPLFYNEPPPTQKQTHTRAHTHASLLALWSHCCYHNNNRSPTVNLLRTASSIASGKHVCLEWYTVLSTEVHQSAGPVKPAVLSSGVLSGSRARTQAQANTGSHGHSVLSDDNRKSSTAFLSHHLPSENKK